MTRLESHFMLDFMVRITICFKVVLNIFNGSNSLWLCVAACWSSPKHRLKTVILPYYWVMLRIISFWDGFWYMFCSAVSFGKENICFLVGKQIFHAKIQLQAKSSGLVTSMEAFWFLLEGAPSIIYPAYQAEQLSSWFSCQKCSYNKKATPIYENSIFCSPKFSSLFQ